MKLSSKKAHFLPNISKQQLKIFRPIKVLQHMGLLIEAQKQATYALELLLETCVSCVSWAVTGIGC